MKRLMAAILHSILGSMEIFKTKSKETTNDLEEGGNTKSPQQSGRKPVITGVTVINKWPCTWVTGVITPINGVISLITTGRGPL